MSSPVLIVDDDDDLRASLAEFIKEEAGVDALSAASLAQARDLGRRVLDCRLAIVDINLGVGQPSGVDVLRWLRDTGFKAPVVFLTGHAKDHPLAVRAAQDASVRILAKPMNVEVLLSLVSSAP